MKTTLRLISLATAALILLSAQAPHGTTPASVADRKDAATHAESATHAEPAGTAARDAWADLLAGNRRFVSGTSATGDLVAARKALASAQHPRTIVLTCSDSRVAPELLFDTSLGEIFVVRTAGNIADTVGLGSIEYAVEHLHAGTLVVLGHTSCGAVAAAVAGGEMPSPSLTAIVERIAPAVATTSSLPEAERPRAAIEANVAQSASDILQNSEIVRQAVDGGHLQVVKAVYDLSTGVVTTLSPSVPPPAPSSSATDPGTTTSSMSSPAKMPTTESVAGTRGVRERNPSSFWSGRPESQNTLVGTSGLVSATR